jgi:hypothetical protein
LEQSAGQYKKDGSLVNFDSGISLANSGFESTDLDIRMSTTAQGGLSTVHIPSDGSDPVKIEIITNPIKH